MNGSQGVSGTSGQQNPNNKQLPKESGTLDTHKVEPLKNQDTKQNKEHWAVTADTTKDKAHSSLKETSSHSSEHSSLQSKHGTPGSHPDEHSSLPKHTHEPVHQHSHPHTAELSPHDHIMLSQIMHHELSTHSAPVLHDVGILEKPLSPKVEEYLESNPLSTKTGSEPEKLSGAKTEVSTQNSEQIKRDQEGIDRAKQLIAERPKAFRYYANGEELKGISQAGRIAIARLLAADDSGFAKVIHIFKIEDENARIGIAKLCAGHVGVGYQESVAPRIGNFGITNKEALGEIAILCVKNDPFDTADNIEKFGLGNSEKDQASLIAIAWELDRAGESLAPHILKFSIEDTDQLEKLALAQAKKHGDKTAEFIADFKIKNPETLTKIAFSCAAHNGSMFQFINNFNITDEALIRKILNTSIQSKSGNPAPHISKFILEFNISETEKKELAILSARNNAATTALNIQQFYITDQNSLVEIALCCADRNGVDTALYIGQFNITDQDAKAQIAARCAKSNPVETAQNLYNFGLDESQTQEIYRICALNAPLKDAIQIATDNGLLIGSLLFHKLANTEDIEEIEPYLGNFIDNKFTYQPQIKKRFDEINSIENSLIRKQQMLQLAQSLFLMKLSLSDEQISSPIMQDGLMAALSFGRPEMRMDLVREVINAVKTNDKIAFSQDDKPWVKMAEILLTNLVSQGMDPKIAQDMIQNIQRKGSEFNNGANNQILIEMLLKLNQTPSLTGAQKGAVLERVLNEAKSSVSQEINKGVEKEIIKNMQAVIGIILFDAPSELVNKDKTLKITMQDLFQQILPIGNVSDFGKAFSETFGSRQSEAIITYAAKIKSLGDDEALNYLGNVVTLILNNEFLPNRYATANNQHLSKLEEASPGILEAWQKPAVYQSKAETKTSDVSGWLTGKLSNSDNLAVLNIGTKPLKPTFLINFLSTDDAAKREQFKTECLNEWERIKKGKKSEEKDSINLQQLCFQAMIAPTTERQIGALNALSKALPSDSPLNKEVQKQISVLIEMKMNPKIIVVDTDNPIDILLSGTEVPRSCLNVNGNPQFNKGLLGYFDGKNRLLAVKNENGEITARCLVRILWDGEKPVLYREKIYPWDPPASKEQENALNALALQKAKDLNLSIVESNTKGSNKPVSDKPLVSFSGTAPWEYCDGLQVEQICQRRGEYTIGADLLTPLVSA